MKKTRTKKLRGRKRKEGDRAEGNQEPAERRRETSREEKQETQPRIAPSRSGQKHGPERAAAPPAGTRESKKPATGEGRARNKNVLKTKPSRREATNATTTNATEASGSSGDTEAERWISLIRQGELDRRVKVRGKTGALLVR